MNSYHSLTVKFVCTHSVLVLCFGMSFLKATDVAMAAPARSDTQDTHPVPVITLLAQLFSQLCHSHRLCLFAPVPVCLKILQTQDNMRFMIALKVIRLLPKKLCHAIGQYRAPLIVLLAGATFGFLIAQTTLSYLLDFKQIDYPMDNPITWLRSHRQAIKTVSDNQTNLLYDKVRILCWVLTNPTNHWKKAQFSKRTWGQHCNILLLMSTADEPVLGTIKLDAEEGRPHLWYKVRAAFRYIHKHHINDADFFMKADDDTYVIPDNLRMMVRTYSPDDPVWFGCPFHVPAKLVANATATQLYMTGGSGYVLSRQAVIRMVEVGFRDPVLCQPKESAFEDVWMGLCMENVNVTAVDTRDSHLKNTFMQLQLWFHLRPPISPKFWYWSYRYYNNVNDTTDNCSSVAVAFHYIEPSVMIMMNYFIRNLTKYGIEDTYLPLL